MVDNQKETSGNLDRTRLLIDYLFLGCDSTSAFHGKGKVTSLNMLDDYPDLYKSFADFGFSFTPDLTLVR